MPTTLQRYIVAISFAAYLIFLYVILFAGGLGVDRAGYGAVNFVPFRTILLFIRAFFIEYYRNAAIVNLAGNLILLLPVGFYLPFYYKKKQRKRVFLLMSAFIILLIEMVQFITGRGSFDIDDLILNSIGVFIGLLIYKVYFKFMTEREELT